jgi:hypothetical protein
MTSKLESYSTRTMKGGEEVLGLQVGYNLQYRNFYTTVDPQTVYNVLCGGSIHTSSAIWLVQLHTSSQAVLSMPTW